MSSQLSPSRPEGRLSIRRALIRLLAVSVIVPAGLIWLVGQLTASDSVARLWHQTSQRLTELVEQETLIYLASGPTALDMNDSVRRLGYVNLEDRRGLLRYLLAGLEAHANVTWYSLGLESGAYLSAYRTPAGEVRLTWREQEGTGARYRDFLVEPDGTWRSLPEKVQPYDPRERIWYQAAAGGPEAVWSRPFLFASGPPGFILSRRLLGPGGEVAGVWGIEYEMAYVSQLLARSSFGRRGRNYLVTKQGEVIGHPMTQGRVDAGQGWVVVQENGERRIASAATHRDPWLRAAWERASAAGLDRHQRFEIEVGGERTLVSVAPFRDPSAFQWLAIVAVPEADILGAIQRNSLWAGLAALAIALGFLIFGVTYATKRLSRPLAGIAGDLREMAQLQTEAPPTVEGSAFAEVADMVAARERMRGGLRSFQKYVPVELVRQLMRQGKEARLGGHARELTVLFSDVADFTRLSEELGEPQLLVEALGEYLHVVGQAIAAHGGTVDKFIGDAVMAFWGAPVLSASHALNACEAAWAIQRRLEEIRPEWRARGRPLFETRMGVNTGTVVVGNIGSAERMNYTVIGDVVNLASRLEGICKLYGLRMAIGSATNAAVEHRFATRPVDCVQVKGKEEVVVFYELLGPHDEIDARTREHAAAHRKAFDLYLARDFAAARRGFEAAREMAREDLAASLLISRCDVLIEQPPPEGWLGAAQLERKK